MSAPHSWSSFGSRRIFPGARAIADRAERRRFVYESLRSVAEAAQRPLLERLSRLGVRHRSHYLVNMLEVEADEATARALAREPGVLAVEANRPAELSRVEPPELAPRREAAAPQIEPNLALIGAPAVWDRGFTGQGIVDRRRGHGRSNGTIPR